MPDKKPLIDLSHLRNASLQAKTYVMARLGDIVGTVADALEELAEEVAKKAEAAQKVTITLTPDGWKEDVGGSYPYIYEYPLSAVTAESRVDVIFTPGSVAIAGDSGMCPTLDTTAGKVIFRSASVPNCSLTGAMYISTGSPVADTGEALTTNNVSAVAISGSYNDLRDRPSYAKVATTGAYSDLTGVPTLSIVAGTGSYKDLTDKPAISKVGGSGKYSDLTGTPKLSAVATTGAYADLSGKPELSSVAISGLYSDLNGAPVITVSTSAPSASDGKDGDIWLVYEE